ncbi:MAG TPA: 5'/3'-nucleotidase SurE [Egicoccus sp.]|nr:5'/3'-nucleotidase SurE [Egicoccus sp.]HSK24190.1 5'/3'-nucleotidase SurE [Egicoccus sp.]
MTDEFTRRLDRDADGTIEVGRPTVVRRPGRILVTNDDGIHSPGLRLLAVALAERFGDVVVAAPSTDLSGTGTGIGRYDPDVGVGLRRADIDGVEAYALDGPPGLAVMAGSMGAFGPAPQLVVSGVNAGINTGHSVLHSGTVGGALTAATFGGSGLAVSLDVDGIPVEDRRWDTAVDVAVSVADWMLRQEAGTVLNVNVPSYARDELRGARWAGLDRFGYFHLASADVADEALTLTVADRGGDPDSGCDTALCMAGWVTLTRLVTVEPGDPPDTDAEAVISVPVADDVSSAHREAYHR